MHRAPKPINEALIRAIRVHIAKLDSKRDTNIGDNFDVYHGKADGNDVIIGINDSFSSDQRGWVGIIMCGMPYIIPRKKCAGLRCVNGAIHINVNGLTMVSYKSGDTEMLILMEENARLKEEAARDAIVRNDMEEEIVILKEEITVIKEELAKYENKRKREEEERSEYQHVNETTLKKECAHCKKTKVISSFQTKVNKKNKEGSSVSYIGVRDICAGCKTKAYRESKKTKVSK